MSLELINNAATRVPVCLCLDASGSMDGEKIDELNDGIKMFFDSIESDEMAKFSADIAIVSFNSGVACVRDFATVTDEPSVPVLQASGNTSMGGGVGLALDMLEQRKDEYKQSGVEYYQPWLVLMTDGYPTDVPLVYSAQLRCSELINQKKLTIFPIAIGDDADLNMLAGFSPKLKPLRLKGQRASLKTI